MNIFYLPDLGEGLPEAEIREWLVNEGDRVEEDQPLVSMETAKALVDVPSPLSGVIEILHGKSGDIIKTGAPLVTFVATEEQKEQQTETKADAGTVVGQIEVGSGVLEEAATGISVVTAGEQGVKASPIVRKRAREFGIDLDTIAGSGPQGAVLLCDLPNIQIQKHVTTPPEGYTELHGVQRSMAQIMTRAHQEVVPVMIVDDADIHHFKDDEDITLRVVRAIQAACEKEPVMNTHFHGASLSKQLRKDINLAMAVDTKAGLYAPVIKDIASKDDATVRSEINAFKEHAKKQDFPADMLHDATITLSNFGVFAGRYANPIVVPPTVTIIGVGKLRDDVVAVDGKPDVHRMMPISVTFDHRAVTGGEAARFLRALIESLSQE